MGASHGAGSDDPLTLLRELTEAVREGLSHGNEVQIGRTNGWFLREGSVLALNPILCRCEALLRSGEPVAKTPPVRRIVEAALRRTASPREMARAEASLLPPADPVLARLEEVPYVQERATGEE